jgi:hypothetical protein
LTFFPQPLHVVTSHPAPVKPSLHMHSLLPPVVFKLQLPWLLHASFMMLLPLEYRPLGHVWVPQSSPVHMGSSANGGR